MSATAETIPPAAIHQNTAVVVTPDVASAAPAHTATTSMYVASMANARSYRRAANFICRTNSRHHNPNKATLKARQIPGVSAGQNSFAAMALTATTSTADSVDMTTSARAIAV